jgi:hypothetical protein
MRETVKAKEIYTIYTTKLLFALSIDITCNVYSAWAY